MSKATTRSPRSARCPDLPPGAAQRSTASAPGGTPDAAACPTRIDASSCTTAHPARTQGCSRTSPAPTRQASADHRPSSPRPPGRGRRRAPSAVAPGRRRRVTPGGVLEAVRRASARGPRAARASLTAQVGQPVLRARPWSVDSSGQGRLVAVLGEAAQHGVDEAGGALADHRPREVDRGRDGGEAGGRPEQQLVGADAQDVAHGRVDLRERPVHGVLQRPVQRALPAQCREREVRGEGAVALVQPGGVERLLDRGPRPHAAVGHTANGPPRRAPRRQPCRSCPLAPAMEPSLPLGIRSFQHSPRYSRERLE